MNFYEEIVKTTETYINTETGFNVEDQQMAEKIVEDIVREIIMQSQIGKYYASKHFSKYDKESCFFSGNNKENGIMVINMLKNKIGEQFVVECVFYGNQLWGSYDISVNWGQKDEIEENIPKLEIEPELEYESESEACVVGKNFITVLINRIKNIFIKC